ncbi:hypothetical protein M011DRAFT_63083 [Sporormia fimetaria CBS 119925]|uniref:Secreted protein n=1 Tax=Sporormia fimetaria CBS 119925 TaxID=1340428 RepID=A0A6A6V917_9PLEO|nr:hypothetical protein M011DRAFT_63083 [Sporormia fimetaria CBS 119925]
MVGWRVASLWCCFVGQVHRLAQAPHVLQRPGDGPSMGGKDREGSVRRCLGEKGESRRDERLRIWVEKVDGRIESVDVMAFVELGASSPHPGRPTCWRKGPRERQTRVPPFPADAGWAAGGVPGCSLSC